MIQYGNFAIYYASQKINRVVIKFVFSIALYRKFFRSTVNDSPRRLDKKKACLATRLPNKSVYPLVH